MPRGPAGGSGSKALAPAPAALVGRSAAAQAGASPGKPGQSWPRLAVHRAPGERSDPSRASRARAPSGRESSSAAYQESRRPGICLLPPRSRRHASPRPCPPNGREARKRAAQTRKSGSCPECSTWPPMCHPRARSPTSAPGTGWIRA
eukprot:scaffold28518_cov131-Isochrysis_galbana.AAC.7